MTLPYLRLLGLGGAGYLPTLRGFGMSIGGASPSRLCMCAMRTSDISSSRATHQTLNRWRKSLSSRMLRATSFGAGSCFGVFATQQTVSADLRQRQLKIRPPVVLTM